MTSFGRQIQELRWSCSLTPASFFPDPPRTPFILYTSLHHDYFHPLHHIALCGLLEPRRQRLAARGAGVRDRI